MHRASIVGGTADPEYHADFVAFRSRWRMAGAFGASVGPGMILPGHGIDESAPASAGSKDAAGPALIYAAKTGSALI